MEAACSVAKALHSAELAKPVELCFRSECEKSKYWHLPILSSVTPAVDNPVYFPFTDVRVQGVRTEFNLSNTAELVLSAEFWLGGV